MDYPDKPGNDTVEEWKRVNQIKKWTKHLVNERVRAIRAAKAELTCKPEIITDAL